MTQILITAAAVAIAVLALLAAAGAFLFNFALNPRSRLSIMARVRTGEVAGTDLSLAAGDPFLKEARAWLERERLGVSIDAFDGGLLHGWMVPAFDVCGSGDGRSLELGAAPAASFPSAAEEGRPGRCYGILCHGYSGDPCDLAREAYMAHNLGMTVVMPAARGHERNADRYVSMGWLDARDLLGWISLITDADPRARIALFGVSMGGAEVMMASGLDLPANVRCIIEDCGYTSVWDEFAYQLRAMFHLPAFPVLYAADAVCRLKAGYGFKRASALEQLRRACVPMLFIHGTEDSFVPYAMLDRVYRACASPVKERFAVEGAGHGASSWREPEAYLARVGGFLNRYL